LAIGVAGLLAVLWLWWTGLSGSASTANHHQGLTRLSGLLAGYATIWLTALIARPPILVRALGPTRLFAWHRHLGVSAFVLVAIHLASVNGHPTTWTMVLAHVAAGAMVLLAVTNLPMVRHRLHRSIWRIAHRLGYGLLWLGLFHQLTEGSDLTRYPLIAVTWVAAFATGLIGLVYRHLIKPLISNRRCQLPVTKAD